MESTDLEAAVSALSRHARGQAWFRKGSGGKKPINSFVIITVSYTKCTSLDYDDFVIQVRIIPGREREKEAGRPLFNQASQITMSNGKNEKLS